MSGAIHIITTYRHGSTWVFDDPKVGLAQEPLVCGIPTLIDTVAATVPRAETGFRLLVCSEPFPGYQVELVKVRQDKDTVWYRWAERETKGYLSAALLKYFSQAPERLYLRAQSGAG
jgi:hypothetical protein